MAVESVALKLPLFWTSCPSAWFAQIEAQFSIRNITADDTKYYYVVSALDSATATRAQSLLVSPPTENKYQAIKEFLISAFDLSEYERASALFAMPGLGDSKPSELMDSMLALMGSHKPCFLFRHLFLQQLSTHIRAPIAQSKIEDYRALAQEADMIYLAGQSHSQNIQEVNTPNIRQNTTKPNSMRQIMNKLCWYHHQHGTRAKKCSSGCKHYSTFQYPGNSSPGQR